MLAPRRSACTPGHHALRIVTGTGTGRVRWFVPLIPDPGAGTVTETVSYRCGG